MCHVLRGPSDGPAYSSLVFAINTLQYPGRVGRPQTNLFSLIKCYLKDRYLKYLMKAIAGFLSKIMIITSFMDTQSPQNFQNSCYRVQRTISEIFSQFQKSRFLCQN